jgi:hypothetical protein
MYVIVLFFCGIGIWFSVRPAHNRETYTNAALSRKIESVLVKNGIVKDNILSQHIKEKNKMAAARNEFYRIIKLKSSKTVLSLLKKALGVLPAPWKVGLSRMDNADGSVTYKFYSPGKNYSNITFMRPKKSSKG